LRAIRNLRKIARRNYRLRLRCDCDFFSKPIAIALRLRKIAIAIAICAQFAKNAKKFTSLAGSAAGRVQRGFHDKQAFHASF
jgi:ribosomal protein L10